MAENILPYARAYGRIIVIGFTFQIVGNTINSAIRTDGSPRYAMLSMMIGAVLSRSPNIQSKRLSGKSDCFHSEQISDIEQKPK